MIPVHLIINGQDFAPVLTSYEYTEEITYEKQVETQDGTIHEYGEKHRPVIQFAVQLSREHVREDYDALCRRPLIVEFDHPDRNILQMPFLIDSDLRKAFAARNTVNGANYYSSDPIILRCKEVIK